MAVSYATAPSGPISQAPTQEAQTYFEEPLVRTASTTEREDADLSGAVSQYEAAAAAGSTTAGVAALERFLDTHPASGWRLGVLVNLGLIYGHSGYFSRSLDAFERAWAIAQVVQGRAAGALADRAAGELLRIHARLGHAGRLADLLRQIGDRGVTGAATEMRDDAREALWLMQHHPEKAYLCGPSALRALLHATGVSEHDLAALDKVTSGPGGMSLGQVADLARALHAAVNMAFRSGGVDIPFPSMIHWKVGHFAAIVGKSADRYEVVDPTFGTTPLWVSRAAIDAESSGYFLLPTQGSPAAGWREITSTEAAHVLGAGYTNNNDPGASGAGNPPSQDPPGPPDPEPGAPGPQPPQPPDPPCGMCAYTFTEMVVSLTLKDSPVGYVPPIGPPMRVIFTYSQREASQPANFSFFNVSPKWTLNWLTYIQDDPTMVGATVSRYMAGGGSINYAYNQNTQSFAPDFYDGAILTYTPSPKPTYQRTLPNGSVETYGLSNGAAAYPRLIFLTQIKDPAGNAVTLNYDMQFRLTSIKDATGRLTTFTYGLASNPLLITEVTDPFGRSARLAYDSSGRLSSITDVIGLTSSFNYDSSSLVDSLTTAYGKTNFSYGDNGNTRYLQATDPLGNTERLEFNQSTSVPGSESTVPAGLINPNNEYLNYRDTFYWDKHAYAVAAGNYTQARVRHWAHVTVNGEASGTTSNTLESVKQPLESRVWYSYLGQPSGYESGTFSKPIQAGRVLDNGSTQLSQTAYNAQGNQTSFVDAAGRTTLWQYAPNGIDMTAMQQMVGGAAVTLGAYTYNSQHKPLTFTDAAGQTTRYSYTAAGQMASMTDPLGHTTRFNYDASSNLSSITNADGKTAASFIYDAFDRVATRTDSEGWTVGYTYDALDRLTQESFPDKTTRTFTYKTLDLMSVKDRQGRVTSAIYDAVRNRISVTDPLGHVTKFSYYENRKPKTLTDPNGNVTTWLVDLQSRVTNKIYANHLGPATTYEASTSRVHAITDALGQTKTFSYGVDDLLTGVTYTNAVNPTPSVGFGYDPFYRRITSMIDGNGTTNYTYYPAGTLGAFKLASENPPFANAAIAYQYDALGRMAARSVGGDSETFSYDTIGRLVEHNDDLGKFSQTYLGETRQLTSRRSGAVGTQWVYGNNLNDRRLTAIINSPVASRYQYTTTSENDITRISEDSGYQIWTNVYDKTDRLTSATSTLDNNYGFGYDNAGNLKTIQTPSVTTNVTSNVLNQVGKYNTTPFTYDANGNLLADYARTYQWDAENRLVGIGYPELSGAATQISYDGLGRRTALVDTSAGLITQTRFAWCGQALCQARSTADVPLKRYLAEGELADSGKLGIYYSLDQLGSVRDAIETSSGLRAAHFDYSPSGVISSSIGNRNGQTDFRYARLYFHALSGIYLSTFRPYDPLLGRWLSRDPIGEHGGLNLYAYVRGNPIRSIDQLGLTPDCPPDDSGAPGDEGGAPGPSEDSDSGDELQQIANALGAANDVYSTVSQALGGEDFDIPGLNELNLGYALNDFTTDPTPRSAIELAASASYLTPETAPFGLGVSLGETATYAYYGGAVAIFGQGPVDEVLSYVGRALGI